MEGPALTRWFTPRLCRAAWALAFVKYDRSAEPTDKVTLGLEETVEGLTKLNPVRPWACERVRETGALATSCVTPVEAI